ncbi:MAG: hypothetical protein OXH70_12135 [Acidobacteria bacterium]|nr:hypothetical protein [Acidobacteriota bacterium]
MPQIRASPPRQRALFHLGSIGRYIAVVEDEELDRRVAEPQEPEPLEVVVELEAAPERGEQQDCSQ